MAAEEIWLWAVGKQPDGTRHYWRCTRKPWPANSPNQCVGSFPTQSKGPNPEMGLDAIEFMTPTWASQPLVQQIIMNHLENLGHHMGKMWPSVALPHLPRTRGSLPHAVWQRERCSPPESARHTRSLKHCQTSIMVDQGLYQTWLIKIRAMASLILCKSLDREEGKKHFERKTSQNAEAISHISREELHGWPPANDHFSDSPVRLDASAIAPVKISPTIEIHEKIWNLLGTSKPSHMFCLMLHVYIWYLIW